MIAVSYDKDFFVGTNEQFEQTNVTLSDIYPNPAEHNVNFILKLNISADVVVTITNIVGQVVRTENIGQLQVGSNALSIDVSELQSGTYFCTVEVDKQKFSRKIIVTR